MKNMKIYRSILSIAIAVFMCLGSSVISSAEGKTTIYVSSNSINVGENLDVEVDASESGNINIKYNQDVLELIQSNVSYTTSGNTVSFSGVNGKITFKAKSAGNSSIVVSSDSNSGSSTSISVSGEGTSNSDTTEVAEESNETSVDASESTGDGVIDADGNVVLNGVKYVVSEKFSDAEIPTGYSRVKVTISNYEYRAVANDNNTLIYLKDASNVSGNGTFFIYNKDTNSVSKFIRLGNESYYVIPMAHESMGEGFVATKIQLEDGEVDGYSYGADNDFAFVYGTDSNGQEGWFQYDKTTGVVQRYNSQLLATSSSDVQPEKVPTSADDLKQKWQRQRVIIAILVFVIVFLVVITINTILMLKKSKRDNFEDDEEYDEDNEIDDVDEFNVNEDLFEDTDDEDNHEDEEDYLGDDIVSDDDVDEEDSEDDFYPDDTEDMKAMFTDDDDLEPEPVLSEDELDDMEELNVLDETEDAANDEEDDDDEDNLGEADDADEADDVEDDYFGDNDIKSESNMKDEMPVEKNVEVKSYTSMRGGAAFKSNKDIKYKSKDEKLTIIDLNDL